MPTFNPDNRKAVAAPYPNLARWGWPLGVHRAPDEYEHPWLVVANGATVGAWSREEAEQVWREMRTPPAPVRRYVYALPGDTPDHYHYTVGDVTWCTYQVGRTFKGNRGVYDTLIGAVASASMWAHGREAAVILEVQPRPGGRHKVIRPVLRMADICDDLDRAARKGWAASVRAKQAGADAFQAYDLEVAIYERARREAILKALLVPVEEVVLGEEEDDGGVL